MTCQVIAFPGAYRPAPHPRFGDAADLYNVLVQEFWIPGNRVEVNLKQGDLQVRMPEALILPDLPRQFRGFNINYQTM